MQTIQIKHFQDPALAQLYVSKLANHGIHSFLSSANMNNALGVGFSTIDLHINHQDFDAAKVIVEGIDLELASTNPNFSIAEASAVDIELEQNLQAIQQQKKDGIFYLLLGLILLGGIVAAIYNYWLLN